MRSLLIFIIAINIVSSSAFAQPARTGKGLNPLYKPISVVQRLSYDNFKFIKLLRASIINYGGGEAEFDRLVDTYAEASALYFQNRLKESASLFTKNLNEIMGVAQQIAQKYRDDTSKLHVDIIKMNVKYNVKLAIDGKKSNSASESVISGASFGLRKANDFFDRSRPIKAMIYYRRAKKSCFRLYKILGLAFPRKFEKDVVDNRNQVFVSKKKKK